MIQYSVDADGIATLTWDQPDRSMNVIDQAAMDALAELIEKVATDDAVKGAVITSGKDGSFVAGADLAMIRQIVEGQQTADELSKSTGALSRILRRMETCGKPFVAAINGLALGGGFEVCLACHHRVASDAPGLKVGLPEATLGLLPGAGGTQRLPRMMGIQGSLGLLMEGKQLRADKGLASGLVDQVVPAATLLDTAKQWILDGGECVQPWDRKGYKVPGGGMQSKTGPQTFMAGTAMFRDKTWGNYPAGLAIMSCVYEGLQTNIDTGLLIESRYMVQLLLNPVAGNMIRTLFLNLQDANKLVRRPADVPKSKVERLGVLGAGLMGAGVAFVSAQCGIEVVLLDRSQDAADKGKAYAAKRLDRDIAKGRATDEKKERILAKIHPTADYADLKGCDLVVEAVFEDRDIKARVTKQAEAVLPVHAVFGSNTSTLPITGLAEASARPEQFIGIHFFSPVERMALVEVIVGEKTNDETLAKTLDFIQQIKKTPIVVNDARGFYTSRVFGTYVSEGIGMLTEGVGAALIENAGRSTGMPMPPLGLADEVGLGLMHQVGIQTKKDLGDAYKPNPSTPVLAVMVEQLDRQGRKNGRGFYDFAEDGSKSLWPGLSEHFAPAAEQPTLESLQERFLYVQAIEAARCVDEGVIKAVEDVDVGAVLGWGFAPWTGGPLSYIDTIGARSFVARADALAAALGERFEVPPGLRAMAEQDGRYYA